MLEQITDAVVFLLLSQYEPQTFAFFMRSMVDARI